jgi:hypothetical protein
MTAWEKIKIAENIVNLLENKFKIWGYKFGFDPIIGLIPVVGDIIPLAISLYLVWIAYTEKVSSRVIGKMSLLILADFIIGLIPVVGDAADFVFRAHLKNLEILKKEVDYQS